MFTDLELTRHFSRNVIWERSANRNLKRCDIEGRHVVFATSFVIVIYNILTYVVVWTGVLDVSFPTSVVDHKYKHQYCEQHSLNKKVVQKYLLFLTFVCKLYFKNNFVFSKYTIRIQANIW